MSIKRAARSRRPARPSRSRRRPPSSFGEPMTPTRSVIAIISTIIILGGLAVAADDELWTFDRLDRIGGHATSVLGNPRLVDTPVGKAVEFDGVDDALMVDVHPLAGAATFTWEAIFRPDGGDQAQRWLHLQETGTDNRMLFELRVV